MEVCLCATSSRPSGGLGLCVVFMADTFVDKIVCRPFILLLAVVFYRTY